MKKLIFVLLLALGAGAAQGQVKFETKSTDAVREMAIKSGKLVFIDLYASWCPPCRMEIPDLVKIHEKYADKGVVIIGLSVDEDKNAVPGFLQKLGVKYPVYMAGSSITRAFGISSIPFNVFVDKKGDVVLAGSGLVEHKDLVEIFDKLLED